MENFGTLQIQSTLRFYHSLRRLLKLNKKPFEISDGFCNFDTVTQPRQLNKRRGARGHTCVHQHSNNRASKFRGQGRALRCYQITTSLSRKCLEKETNQNSSWIRFSSSCDFYHPLFSIRTSFILRFWLTLFLRFCLTLYTAVKNDEKSLIKIWKIISQSNKIPLYQLKLLSKMRLFCSIFQLCDCSKTWPICVNHQMINCPLSFTFPLLGYDVSWVCFCQKEKWPYWPFDCHKNEISSITAEQENHP